MLHYTYESGNHRVAVYDGVRRVGECVYHETADGWSIDHTEVDADYAGQGIAAELLAQLVRQARIRRVCLTPVCSYACRAFEKNPDYAAMMPAPKAKEVQPMPQPKSRPKEDPPVRTAVIGNVSAGVLCGM